MHRRGRLPHRRVEHLSPIQKVPLDVPLPVVVHALIRPYRIRASWSFVNKIARYIVAQKTMLFFAAARKPTGAVPGNS